MIYLSPIMKLFIIANTFDKKQWDGFLTYVGLYHTPKSTISKIAASLDAQSIWKNTRGEAADIKQLYSNIPFKVNSKSFSNSLGVLGNLAEEYVGWMVWKEDQNLKTSCQLLGLAKKSLSDQYLKTQKEVLKRSDDSVISIWDEHYRMVSIFNDYYFTISSSDDNYTIEFNELVAAFRKSTATIAQFLLVEIRNREKLLSENWKQHESFFEMLYTNETDLNHVTDELIKMNYKGKNNAYNVLRDILWSTEINKFSTLIQYSIVSYCTVFLTKKIKQGEIHRGQELLDLYEYGLKNEIFILNDSMPIKKFINIIGVASKLEKYDWARKVVDNWAYKVDKLNYKSVVMFGHATIDFHQRKFSKVVEALFNMKSPNFQHRLRFRWLLLRAQYEFNKDYLHVVKAQVENFRRFLVSNESRINKPTYDGLKASLKIITMLMNRMPIAQVENYYVSSKYIFERKWIIEKIKSPAY